MWISRIVFFYFLSLLFVEQGLSDNQHFGGNDSLLTENFIDLSDIYSDFYIPDSALCFYKKALKCMNCPWDIKDYHTIYFGLCLAYLDDYNYDSSLYYGKKAYDLLKSYDHSDSLWQIKHHEKISFILGHLYSICNEYDVALQYYSDGIKYVDSLSLIEPSFDKRLDLSWYYSNIAAVCFELSHYSKAIEYYDLSIDLQNALPENSELYSAYNYLSLAEILILKGDYFLALIYYQHVINVYKKHYGHNTVEVGIVYNNIGLVYFNKGDYSKSLNYFNKAMNIVHPKRNNAIEVLANIYNNLADVYRKLNKYELAEDYFYSVLTIYDTLYANYSLETAFLYNNLANLYKDTGEYDRALKYYFSSLFIREKILGKKHDKIAQVYQNIGIVFSYKHNFDSALVYFQKAIGANTYGFNNLNILTNPSLSSGIISKAELLETLIHKAEALLKLNGLCVNPCDTMVAVALETYDLAIKMSDYLRFEYQNDQSRLLLNSKTQQIYHHAINYLLQLDNQNEYFEKTFEYCERSKNYHLFTRLFEQRAKQASGVPWEIIEKEKELLTLIDIYQIKVHHAALRDSFSISKYKKKIFDLSNEQNDLVSNLENNYPNYYKKRYDFNVPNVLDIQNELKRDQALLNYYYDDSLLYIYVISSDTFFILKNVLSVSFNKNINNFIRSINLIRIQECFDLAFLLYQELFKPILNSIDSKKELIIIPHGILYFIPFEALISIPIQYDHSLKIPYIINNFSIKYHYSVSLWYSSINKTPNIKNPFKYNYDFIGFAPVFINDNSNNICSDTIEKENDLLAFNEFGSPIEPLPYSGEEVQSIYSLFRQHGKKARSFLFQTATEENFKTNIKQAKYVHLATHGLINYSEPFLSGLLFYNSNLNPEYFNRNNPDVNTNDGILYLNELYGLDINAKLIIISACESGTGKLEKSEGIMSMTRGLLFAGAKNIIISLYKVPDKHTKDLMFEFYQKMLLGYPYAEALRLAKLELINKNSSFPKIWSSFILVGI